MRAKSAKMKPAILRRVCKLIPPHLVAKRAPKHAVTARAITPWSCQDCRIHWLGTRLCSLVELSLW